MKEYALHSCRCGGKPEMIETYDTLQIVCPVCGRRGPLFSGECCGEMLDEICMYTICGRDAAEIWNREMGDEDRCRLG